jgi:inorganic pyrophosphatase
MADMSKLDARLDPKTATCRAVVECPKGSSVKYAYDPAAEAFEMKRLLPDGMCFPLDFGFVPSTRGQDGDPLDILVVNDTPASVGTLLTVRLIGVIEAEQTEKGKTVRNDRLLSVAEVSHLFEGVETPADFGEAFMRNLTQFWVNYSALRGATFKVLAVRDSAAAVALVRGPRRAGRKTASGLQG